MKKKRKLSEDKQIALRQLAEELAQGSIVTQCLARYLYQIMEYVYEAFVKPREQRIAELETQLADCRSRMAEAGIIFPEP